MSRFKQFEIVRRLGILIAIYMACLSVHAQSIPSDQIQVSIRSALDKMYDLELDSFSTIPAIVQHDNDFSVTLQKSINYDTFPHFLHNELANRKIDLEYSVKISRCSGDSIILAYDRLSFINQNTPCKARHTEQSCQVLKITFREQKLEKTSVAVPLILSFTILSIGLVGFIYIKKKESKSPESLTSRGEILNVQTFNLGDSTFNAENQLIICNNQEKTLTHRESKLLEYFAKHPNLILKRDDITDAVWKEDGIITGRSLDVFVSRLRKILSMDERLQIKNIHGVGYKLEIS